MSLISDSPPFPDFDPLAKRVKLSAECDVIIGGLEIVTRSRITPNILTDVGVNVLEDNEEEDDNDDVNGKKSGLFRFENARISNCHQSEHTPAMSAISNDITPKIKRAVTGAHNVTDDYSTPFFLRRRPKAQAYTGKDHSTRLSDEIILHIFKLLPKSALHSCARTCKRWKRLAYDESLWKRLNLGSQRIDSDILGHIIGRGVVTLRLAKADITNSVNLTPVENFMKQRHWFCKLQHLDLSMATMNTSALEEIIGCCNKLHNLSLEYCTVNDEVCRLISGNQNIKQLNLAMCVGLTLEGLQHINSCEKLEALNLAWTNLTKETLDIITRTVPRSLLRLNLSGCRKSLFDDHIERLVLRCPSLVELDLSDSFQLTHKIFKSIVFNLDDLKSLAISRCAGISPESYTLLQSAQSLTNLEIFGLFNKPGLECIKETFPSLNINTQHFSTIARPTTGIRRTSIWEHPVRD